MAPIVTNLLLTGPSGVGKSMLLRRVADRLDGSECRGFLSASVWDGPDRLGWRLDAVDGSDGGFVAHREISSLRRMGPYGVDLELFERVALRQIAAIDNEALYFIDEIGRISSWSPSVTSALEALLDSSAHVVAIVRERNDGASPQAERAKARADSHLVVVTIENRDALVDEICKFLTRPA